MMRCSAGPPAPMELLRPGRNEGPQPLVADGAEAIHAGGFRSGVERLGKRRVATGVEAPTLWRALVQSLRGTPVLEGAGPPPFMGRRLESLGLPPLHPPPLELP